MVSLIEFIKFLGRAEQENRPSKRKASCYLRYKRGGQKENTNSYSSSRGNEKEEKA